MNNRAANRLPAASEILAPELEGERHEEEAYDHGSGGGARRSIHTQLRTTNDLGIVLGDAAVGDELGTVLSNANPRSEGRTEIVQGYENETLRLAYSQLWQELLCLRPAGIMPVAS